MALLKDLIVRLWLELYIPLSALCPTLDKAVFSLAEVHRLSMKTLVSVPREAAHLTIQRLSARPRSHDKCQLQRCPVN